MSQQTLPCNPPPQKKTKTKKTLRVGLFFSCRCLVSTKNVLNEKPVLLGDIQVKSPKNVFFEHIHSNNILIN